MECEGWDFPSELSLLSSVFCGESPLDARLRFGDPKVG